MSNLAYKVQQKQVQEQKQSVQQKVVVKKRPLFTFGEKVLFAVFLGMVLIGSILVISNYVKLYNVNMDIQAIEAEMSKQQKINTDLYIQQEELSNPERIWKKAKDAGLTLNPNNVKGVQD
ncbi:cell division protein FtsL [Bacillus sp. FJAT-47783]|uniref:cell division protein FtsL n=1 Tax=Bacillus sp. FJAT-47783 TaxID=2922712 RepID=UPI001FAD0349|nr:cell division protein FtsL [Bacillus sp. FJAT-47783]